MTRLVQCAKLNKELPGFEEPPYPGAVGEKIYNEISLQAWDMWLNHQTMLINEYRLNVLDPKSKSFLETEMDKFLFGGGSEKPPGFQEKSLRLNYK